MIEHSQKVQQLQKAIKALKDQESGTSPVSLHYGKANSNTTRTKSYKHQCCSIEFGEFNEVLRIDPNQKIAIVEPRVTMEQLLQATLPYHLAPPILPEFKKITVGGAIMGGAAESGSHSWGCFNDICLSHEIISGNGELLKVSPSENQEIYYGIAGSYGSLGTLVSTEIQLIPISDYIYLTYHLCKPLEAIEKLSKREDSTFLDGIIFSKDSAVIIAAEIHPKNIEQYSQTFSFNSPCAPWFYQHAKQLTLESTNLTYHEKMDVKDYFFRYDLGAFWMGAYLFKMPFFNRFIREGILGFQNTKDGNFSAKDIASFNVNMNPPLWGRTIFRPFLKAKNLWRLLHQAEQWIQKKLVIQDFCIPRSHAINFCEEILLDPGIFPIWLCPIKGTQTPQIFMPHLLSSQQADPYFINFGVYGIPQQATSIQQATKKLEERTQAYGGRKTLYSHSYYTENEFWQIYSRESYENLRRITGAQGRWLGITEKVLSN